MIKNEEDYEGMLKLLERALDQLAPENSKDLEGRLRGIFLAGVNEIRTDIAIYHVIGGSDLL